MKTISISIILSICLFCACQEDYNRPLYDDEQLGKYVHFSLLLDHSGMPITDQVASNRTFASTFLQNGVRTLYVPVSLSATNLRESVQVEFSSHYSGGDTLVQITPNKILTFGPNKYQDTIEVKLCSRWTSNMMDTLTLRLENCSDPSVHLGYPYDSLQESELAIIFNDPSLSYGTGKQNKYMLLGEKGEQVDFQITFPEGLLAEELQGTELLKMRNTSFAYSLKQHPYESGETQIRYTLTLEESLNPDENYYSLLELATLENYELEGLNYFKFSKDAQNKADNQINPAAHLYDLRDQYYRIYFHYWIDYRKDGNCVWRESSVFTQPVEVDQSHPNAVLHENGKYYHAFRLGFVSPTHIGTNSFGLRNYFNNESSNLEDSPGFNIPEAFELHPLGDTSTTQGTVTVIQQDLQIANRSGKQYIFNIAGQGTYHYVEGSYETYSDSIFQIEIELALTNEEVLGGTINLPYYFYNRNPGSSELPEVSPLECTPGYDL